MLAALGTPAYPFSSSMVGVLRRVGRRVRGGERAVARARARRRLLAHAGRDADRPQPLPLARHVRQIARAALPARARLRLPVRRRRRCRRLGVDARAARARGLLRTGRASSSPARRCCSARLRSAWQRAAVGGVGAHHRRTHPRALRAAARAPARARAPAAQLRHRGAHPRVPVHGAHRRVHGAQHAPDDRPDLSQPRHAAITPPHMPPRAARPPPRRRRRARPVAPLGAARRRPAPRPAPHPAPHPASHPRARPPSPAQATSPSSRCAKSCGTAPTRRSCSSASARRRARGCRTSSCTRSPSPCSSPTRSSCGPKTSTCRTRRGVRGFPRPRPGVPRRDHLPVLRAGLAADHPVPSLILMAGCRVALVLIAGVTYLSCWSTPPSCWSSARGSAARSARASSRAARRSSASSPSRRSTRRTGTSVPPAASLPCRAPAVCGDGGAELGASTAPSARRVSEDDAAMPATPTTPGRESAADVPLDLTAARSASDPARLPSPPPSPPSDSGLCVDVTPSSSSTSGAPKLPAKKGSVGFAGVDQVQIVQIGGTVPTAPALTASMGSRITPPTSAALWSCSRVARRFPSLCWWSRSWSRWRWRRLRSRRQLRRHGGPGGRLVDCGRAGVRLQGEVVRGGLHPLAVPVPAVRRLFALFLTLATAVCLQLVKANWELKPVRFLAPVTELCAVGSGVLIFSLNSSYMVLMATIFVPGALSSPSTRRTSGARQAPPRRPLPRPPRRPAPTPSPPPSPSAGGRHRALRRCPLLAPPPTRARSPLALPHRVGGGRGAERQPPERPGDRI